MGMEYISEQLKQTNPLQLPTNIIEDMMEKIQVPFPKVQQLKALGVSDKADLLQYLSQCDNPEQVIEDIATNRSVSVSSTLDGAMGAKKADIKNLCSAAPRFVEYLKNLSQ